MSKINVNYSLFKESYKVADATLTTGWKAGIFMSLNSNSEAVISDDANFMFLALDPSSNLAVPPTGSLVTGLHGPATLFISHAPEVAAGDSGRVYEANVESAAIADPLYVSANGKFTTTAGPAVSVGNVLQVPNVTNNYTLGVQIRTL